MATSHYDAYHRHTMKYITVQLSVWQRHSVMFDNVIVLYQKCLTAMSVNVALQCQLPILMSDNVTL
jgi:hypothetical protein